LTKRLNAESPFSYPSRPSSIICVASAPLASRIQRFFVSLLVVHPRPLRPVIAPLDVGVSLHAPHNVVAVRASVSSPDYRQFRPRRPIIMSTHRRTIRCLVRLPRQNPFLWLRHRRRPTPYSRPSLAPHGIVPLYGRSTASQSVPLRVTHMSFFVRSPLCRALCGGKSLNPPSRNILSAEGGPPAPSSDATGTVCVRRYAAARGD